MTTTKQIGQVKWFNNKIGYGLLNLLILKIKKTFLSSSKY